MMKRLGWLLVLVALLLGGCGGLFRPAAEWPRVGDEFINRLRWRDYAGAAALVDESQRTAFLAWPAALSEVQPVDARLESYVLKDEDKRAEAVAVLDYYRLPSARVQSWRMHQQWEYQGGGALTPGTWRLVAPLPNLPE